MAKKNEKTELTFIDESDQSVDLAPTLKDESITNANIKKDEAWPSSKAEELRIQKPEFFVPENKIEPNLAPTIRNESILWKQWSFKREEKEPSAINKIVSSVGDFLYQSPEEKSAIMQQRQQQLEKLMSEWYEPANTLGDTQIWAKMLTQVYQSEWLKKASRLAWQNVAWIVWQSDIDLVLKEGDRSSYLDNFEISGVDNIFWDNQREDIVQSFSSVLNNPSIQLWYEALVQHLEITSQQYEQWIITEEEAFNSINEAKSIFEESVNQEITSAGITKKDKSLFSMEDFHKMYEISWDYYSAVRERQQLWIDISSWIISEAWDIFWPIYRRITEYQPQWLERDEKFTPIFEQKEERRSIRQGRVMESLWDSLRFAQQSYLSWWSSNRLFKTPWVSGMFSSEKTVTFDQLSEWVNGIYNYWLSEMSKMESSMAAFDAMILEAEEAWHSADRIAELKAQRNKISQSLIRAEDWVRELSKHYIENFWKEWYRTQDEYLEKLKEDGVPLEKYFGMEVIWDTTLSSSIWDYWTVKTDEYFAWHNLRMMGQGGVIEKWKRLITSVVSGIWGAGGGISAVFESVSNIGWSDISKIEWWKLKNAMFYIDPSWWTLENIDKFSNSMKEIWPEIVSIAWQLAAWGKVSALFGKLTPNIARSTASIWRVGSWLANALNKWQDITRFLSKGVASSKVINFSQRILNWLVNVWVTWPIYSGIFEQFNPWTYSESDLIFDVTFWALEMARDTFRAAKLSFNNQFNINSLIKNYDFQSSFSKKVFWFTDEEWDGLSQSDKWFFLNKSRNFLQSAYSIQSIVSRGDNETYNSVMKMFSSAKRWDLQISKDDFTLFDNPWQLKWFETKLRDVLTDAEVTATRTKSARTADKTKKYDNAKNASVFVNDAWIPDVHIDWSAVRAGNASVDWRYKDWFDAKNYKDWFSSMTDEQFALLNIDSGLVWKVSPKYAIFARLFDKYEWVLPSPKEIDFKNKESVLSIFDTIMVDAERVLKEGGVESVSLKDFPHHNSDAVFEQLQKWKNQGSIPLGDESISRNDLQTVMNFSPMRVEKFTWDIGTDIIIYAYASVMHWWVRVWPKTITKRTLLQTVLAKKLWLTSLDDIPWELDRPRYEIQLNEMAKRYWYDAWTANAMISVAPKLISTTEAYFSHLIKQWIEVNTDKSAAQLVAEYIELSIKSNDVTMLQALRKDPVVALSDMIAKLPESWKMLPHLKILDDSLKLDSYFIPNLDGGGMMRVLSDKKILELKRATVYNSLTGGSYLENPLDYVTDRIIDVLNTRFPSLSANQKAAISFAITWNKNLKRYWATLNEQSIEDVLTEAGDVITLQNLDNNIPKEIEKIKKAKEKVKKIYETKSSKKKANLLKRERKKTIKTLEENKKKIEDYLEKWDYSKKLRVKGKAKMASVLWDEYSSLIEEWSEESLRDLLETINITIDNFPDEDFIEESIKIADQAQSILSKYEKRLQRLTKSFDFVSNAIRDNEDSLTTVDTFFNASLRVLPRDLRTAIQEKVDTALLYSSDELSDMDRLQVLHSAILDEYDRLSSVVDQATNMTNKQIVSDSQKIDDSYIDALNRSLDRLEWEAWDIDDSIFYINKNIEENAIEAIEATESASRQAWLRYEAETEKAYQENIKQWDDIFVTNSFFSLNSIKGMLWEAYMRPNKEMEVFLMSSNVSRVRMIDDWGNVKEVPLWPALYAYSRDNSAGNYKALELLLDISKWMDGRGYRNPIWNALVSTLNYAQDMFSRMNMTIWGEVPDTKSFLYSHISSLQKAFDAAWQDWEIAISRYIELLSEKSTRKLFAKKDFKQISEMLEIPESSIEAIYDTTASFANELSQLSNMFGGRAVKSGNISTNIKRISKSPSFANIDNILSALGDNETRSLIVSGQYSESLWKYWITQENFSEVSNAVNDLRSANNIVDNDDLLRYISTAEWESAVGRLDTDAIMDRFWSTRNQARQIIDIANSMFSKVYSVVSPELPTNNIWYKSSAWVWASITNNVSEYLDETLQSGTFSLHNFLWITDRKKYAQMVKTSDTETWKKLLQEFFNREISDADYHRLASVFSWSNWLDNVHSAISSVIRAMSALKASVGTVLTWWAALVSTAFWLKGSFLRKGDYDRDWAKSFSEEFWVGKIIRNYSDDQLMTLWGNSVLMTASNIAEALWGTTIPQVKEAIKTIPTQWYYMVTETMYAEKYMVMAMAQALETTWYRNFDEYSSYLRSLPQDQRIKELTEFNNRTDLIVETQTGTLFNPTLSRLMWNSRTLNWSLPTSVLWRTAVAARNLAYYTWTFLSSRWMSHMKNYRDMIKNSARFERNRYSEILISDWYEAAEQYVRNRFLRDYKTTVAVTQLIATFALANRIARVDSNDDVDAFNRAEMMFAPIQSLQSSSIWRIMFSTLQQLFHEDNWSGDRNEILRSSYVWLWQFMQEMSRIWRIPYDVFVEWWVAAYTWLRDKELAENFEWWSRSLVQRLWSYWTLLADDISRNSFTFKTSMWPQAIYFDVLPLTPALMNEFYDASLQWKLDLLEKQDSREVAQWALSRLGMFRGYYLYEFAKDDPSEKLMRDIHSDPQYLELIIWDNPSVRDSDFASEHFLYRMTRGNIQKQNSIMEWSNESKLVLSDYDDDDIKNINASATMMEQNMLSLLESSLEEEDYSTFVEIMSKENSIGVKQWLYLLQMIEADSPWSGRELLAAVVQQQYFDATNEAKKRLWYWYWSWRLSDLNPDVDMEIKKQIVDQRIPVYREVDKYWYSLASNAYIYDKILPEWAKWEDYFSGIRWDDGKLIPYWTITPWSFQSEKWWDYFGSSKVRTQKYIYDISMMALADNRYNILDMNNIFTTLFNVNRWDISNEEKMVSVWNMAIQAIDFIEWSSEHPDRKKELIWWIAAATAPYASQILGNEKLMAKHKDHFDKMYSYIWRWLSDLWQLKEDAEIQSALEEMGVQWSEMIYDMIWDWSSSWGWSSGWGWALYDPTRRTKSNVLSFSPKAVKAKNLIRKFAPNYRNIPKNIDWIERPDYNRTAQSLLQLKAVLRDAWRISSESEISRPIPKLRYNKWKRQRRSKAKKLKL